MQWFLKCIKNYATFKGRARRKEYWMFTLVILIVSMVFGILLNIFTPETLETNQSLDTMNTVNNESSSPIGDFIQIIYLLFNLFIILPGIAVAVRRLHDTNRAGWWYFILFIPIVGSIILLIFLCLDGDMNENKYGPNPKAEL